MRAIVLLLAFAAIAPSGSAALALTPALAQTGATSGVTALPAAIGGPTHSSLYLSSGNSSFYPQSWILTQTPDLANTTVGTSVNATSSSTQNGYFLLMPGLTNTSILTSAVPQPATNTAYGWMSDNQIGLNLPAGQWNATFAVNVTASGTPKGTLTLGAAVFLWSQPNKRFTQMFSFSNTSFNIAGKGSGNFMVNMTSAGPAVSFLAKDYLFVELYLDSTSFRSNGNFHISLDVGGDAGANYFVQYPEFGWLNGSVSPQSASVEINGSPVAVNSQGAFSLALAPGTYSVYASMAGYVNSTASYAVQSGSATIANIVLTQLLTVKFEESGLPSGTNWSVTLGGKRAVSNNTAIMFIETAGAYNYTVAPVNGYNISIASGTVYLTTFNQTLNATFESANTTGTTGGGNPGGGTTPAARPFSWLYLLLFLALIVAVSVAGTAYYFRRGGGRHSARQEQAAKERQAVKAAPQSVTGTTDEQASETAAASAAATTASAGPSKTALDGEAIASMLKSGNTIAFLEDTAVKSMAVFEAGLKTGLKGLCFSREYPEKLTEKHNLGGATLVWISNVWAEGSIRPKDLEKITLRCDELLSSARSIILIDGLESLITSNGFLSVIKMLGFLRDATALHQSILLISVNQNVITPGEAGLLKREVDRIIE